MKFSLMSLDDGDVVDVVGDGDDGDVGEEEDVDEMDGKEMYPRLFLRMTSVV